MELRNALASRFGVELGPTATFDYPTVAALAQFIASSMAPAVEDLASSLEGDVWEDEEAALHVVGMSCAYPGKARRLPAHSIKVQTACWPARARAGHVL